LKKKEKKYGLWLFVGEKFLRVFTISQSLILILAHFNFSNCSSNPKKLNLKRNFKKKKKNLSQHLDDGQRLQVSAYHNQ
jgi:hypothetical protein